MCKPITFNDLKGQCREFLEQCFFMDQFPMSLIIVVSYFSISLKEHNDIHSLRLLFNDSGEQQSIFFLIRKFFMDWILIVVLGNWWAFDISLCPRKTMTKTTNQRSGGSITSWKKPPIKSVVALRGFIPCRIPGPDQSQLHIKSKDVKIK